MKKNVYILLTIIVFTSLTSCKNTNLPTLEDNNIPYIVANNYFVKTDTILRIGKITNQEDFDAVFGAATVMGENGKPTAINFEKQYVVAVIEPETNEATTISPISITKNEEGLLFTYQIEKGETQSYTIIPFTMLVLDNQYDEVLYFNLKK